MKKDRNELKVRAKRLRSAIKSVLDVKVSIAQSLELVAKEENYPTWDAACACRSQLNEGRKHQFLDSDSVKIESPYIVIGGRSGSGKSTLARKLANRMAKASGEPGSPLKVVVISTTLEWEADCFASTLNELSDIEFRLSKIDIGNSILLIDESHRLKLSDDFWKKLMLKSMGVIITVHTNANKIKEIGEITDELRCASQFVLLNN